MLPHYLLDDLKMLRNRPFLLPVPHRTPSTKVGLQPVGWIGAQAKSSAGGQAAVLGSGADRFYVHVIILSMYRLTWLY